MGSWAKSAVVWVKDQEAGAKIDSERFIEERRLIRSQGLTRWREVRDGLDAGCQELELEAGKKVLGFEVCPQTQAVIRNLLTGRVMNVQLDLDAAQIEWSCGNRKGTFILKPESSSSVAISSRSGTKFETEEVINVILDTALGKAPSDFITPPPFDRL
ncbi:MAG: hypothetical protein ABSH28_24635 [Acidobacteriota bacterium]|jgi:hypothetical protein